MKINGSWTSSSGSILRIRESNGRLSGTFQLGSDKHGTKHKIYGSIDPSERGRVRPLSFSVAWTDEKGKSVHSVTSYTGQLSTKAKRSEIEVVFLIAHNKTPLWKGTGISYETFSMNVLRTKKR